MMWDNECEREARGLLYGQVDSFGKPSLDEQWQVANRLNPRLPYPGWRLSVQAGTRWWECVNDADDGVRVVELHGRYEAQSFDRDTTKHDTLVEAIAALELKL